MEKRKSYDVKFKLQIVDVAKMKSIARAARKFKIDSKKRVREWKKKT